MGDLGRLLGKKEGPAMQGLLQHVFEQVDGAEE